MFWMIIPHVSIVSSLLLAGNNPSIWGAVSSTIEESHEPVGGTTTTQKKDPTSTVHGVSALKWGLHYVFKEEKLKKARKFRNMVLRPIFNSEYKTAWLWNRGSSKALWLAKYSKAYPRLSAIESEVLNMTLKQWFFSIFSPALFLLVVPSFLAGMIR
jgi:hypothetical protein